MHGCHRCQNKPWPLAAAPITAANLLLNIKAGMYNNAPLSVSGVAVLVGSQPADAAHLVRGDCLGDPPESVPGSGFDLDEHHRAPVSGDHVQFAVPAPPVTRHDPKTQRAQVVNGHLLAARSEFLSTV